MVARDIAEAHRAATPLELFFDLCFVVAVAQAATSLHHALAEDHLGQAFVGYPMVFFAIWWAWMNFTWFASAYDNDDVAYRVAILVQMAGVLILAAGVPRAFDERDFGVVTLGYAVMRLSLVAQWLRAARSDPARRVTDNRYAVGVAACMAGWASLLLLPEDWRLAGWLVLVPAELLVPVWAERVAPTTWHPGHITERYGLFTIIVLGEAVLGATIAVQTGLDRGDALGGLGAIAAGGLLTVFSMWWLYFAQPARTVIGEARANFGTTSTADSFIWGYGHLVVFAAAAAVGAGLGVAVEQASGATVLTARAATAAVSIPVALYLLSMWVLHARRSSLGQGLDAALPVVAVLVVAVTVVVPSVLAVGLLLAGLVALVVRSTA
jgi:low temperature requirement protein LtrA